MRGHAIPARLSSTRVSIPFRRLWSGVRRWGVILLAGAAAAAVAFLYVGVAKLVTDSRTTAPAPNQNGAQLEASRPPTFPPSDYRQSGFPRSTREPLIGVNYTHHGFRGCSYDGTGILRSYHQPGIARKVHRQLFSMRKAGVTTIRTVLWHMTDATDHSWGPLSSAGGRIQAPYRANLIYYLQELRRFGFARFTVSFAPQGTNNPLLPTYEQSKLAENWRFTRTVRRLVKRYGPRTTRFDLMNEGAPSEAPSEWSPVPSQTGRYLRTLYKLYVRHYGNRDVTVSSIANEPRRVAERLRQLVRILKQSRVPLPRWYDVHIPYESSRASFALQQVDRVLKAGQQDQPLVIGETAYNNRGVANAIRQFLTRASRRVSEVSPWFQYTPRGCQIPPPYEPGAYRSELGSL